MSLAIMACGCGPGAHDLSVSFDDDGYYWFLWPLFERLAAATDQTIDLYGDATFGQKDLPLLRAVVDEAKQLVEAQPMSWQVRVGRSVSGGDVVCTVRKSVFVERIARLGELVDRAQRDGGYVQCIGD